MACFGKKASHRKWCWKQHLRGLLGYCLPATRPSCIAFLILFRLNDYLRELPNTEWSENPLSRSLTCLLSNELFCRGTSFPHSLRTRLHALINYCLCEGQRTNRQKTRAIWYITAVNSSLLIKISGRSRGSNHDRSTRHMPSASALTGRTSNVSSMKLRF